MTDSKHGTDLQPRPEMVIADANKQDNSMVCYRVTLRVSAVRQVLFGTKSRLHLGYQAGDKVHR